MKFNERLIEFMNENRYEQKDIVSKCKVNKSTLSQIINDKRSPNIEFLTELSNLSKKSINWWLFGVDEYNNLYSLNELIDFFIDKKYIDIDGNMDKTTYDMLNSMLIKEINVKLDNKYPERKKRQE